MTEPSWLEEWFAAPILDPPPPLPPPPEPDYDADPPWFVKKYRKPSYTDERRAEKFAEARALFFRAEHPIWDTDGEDDHFRAALPELVRLYDALARLGAGETRET